MWRISPHGMIRRQAACLRDSRQSSGRLKSLEAVAPFWSEIKLVNVTLH